MICIYAIINIIDDKHYVGQASDRDFRWREHRKSLRGFYHHSLFLQRAWIKHGERNFIFVVLEVLDDVSKLNEREVHWGNLLKPEYNVAPFGGSMRGYKHTDEARSNMSEAHKGYKASTETRAKMSIAHKGNKNNLGKKRKVPTSEETRKRISEAKKAGYEKRRAEKKEALDKLWNLNISVGTSSWPDIKTTEA